MVDEINSRAWKDPVISDYRYDSMSHFSVQVDESTRRPFVAFDCPMLGYRELLFPIFCEDRVIAALFVGQIVIKNNESMIVKQQQRYFEKFPYTEQWEQYRLAKRYHGYDSLAQLVRSKHDEWFGQLGKTLTDSDYLELIQRSSQEIAQFEVTLRHQLEILRERFVREKLEKQVKRFQTGLVSTTRKSSNDPIRGIWRKFQSCLKQIVEDFALAFVIVFGVNELVYGSEKEQGKLRIVAHAGAIPPQLQECFGKLYFEINSDSHNRFDLSNGAPVEAPELFSRLGGCELDRTTNDVRLLVYPTPFDSQGSTAILIGYSSENPSTSIENQKGGRLDSALNTFFVSVFSNLAAALQALAQIQMSAVLKVFGHEMGQITVGLDWLRVLYLDDPSHLRQINDSKAVDLARDIEGYVRQLHFLSNTASHVLGKPIPKKQHFWAYRELLFKWKDTYRLEAERKCLQFVLVYPDTADPLRPQVYGDPILLEQLLYNLVGNAIKYCHRGTKIYLDCKKVALEPGSAHELLVTDYGLPVNEGRKIYELFRRGTNATESGLGVGLHVAQQIAVAHGGNIVHDSQNRISRFNVPLMEAYLKHPRADKQLARQVSTELDRLVKTDQYFAVIALDEKRQPRYSKPMTHEILDNIENPTYQVTFRVLIPAKDGKS